MEKLKAPVILAAVVCMVSCASVNGQKEAAFTDRHLGEIERVQQPDNRTCGAANVQMVMNHYFSESDDIYAIFKEISDVSSMGVLNNRTYKMGQYLEKNDLHVSIIRFTDLSAVLAYCENFQIPAIMNIQTTKNSSYGHYVLFVQFVKSEGMVRIRDPYDSSREWITLTDLKNNFVKVFPDSEVGGNVMILATDTEHQTRKYMCICGKVNQVERELLQSIEGIFCTRCSIFRRCRG